MHVLFYETASAISIDLETYHVINWFYNEEMYTNYKTADECVIQFERASDSKLFRYLGYVPNCFPGNHYGDYILLNISAEGLVRKLKISDSFIDSLIKHSG